MADSLVSGYFKNLVMSKLVRRRCIDHRVLGIPHLGQCSWPIEGKIGAELLSLLLEGT